MAEINFNNLYNQLSPMDKMFYDQQFKKSYNPNQENIMLSSQPAYEQMKSAYDAQQQVPEKSFFDLLNPFSSASAAEMPPVPNVSLGTPKINFNTGITSASSAIPMINNVPMINTGAVNQDLQNTDLVSQIIAANQVANVNKFGNTVAPFSGNQFSQVNNQVPQINNQVPLGFDTSYGVANEADVEQEFLPDQEPSGIAKLFEFLGKLPTPFNLARRGLESLRGLNNRIQGSDFGQATSLMDYLDMRKYGGLQGRNDAAARNMAQARGITKSLASRPSSTSGGYQRGPGGSGAQNTGASTSQSQAGPGFSGSGSASEMGSF